MPGDQRDYRIRPVRRGVYRIWFLLAGLLLALAFYGSYRLGGYHLRLNYGELLAHFKRQGAELTELNADRDRLVKEVATFQLRHELEKTARQAAVAELGAQRERVNALRKELELYAGLVNRKVRSDELLIHRAVVEKVAGEGQYRYELLLAQPLKVNGMVEGMATVALVVGDENHALSVANTRHVGSTGVIEACSRQIHGTGKADELPINMVKQAKRIVLLNLTVGSKALPAH